MTGGPKVRDYMSRELVVFTPEMDLHRAIKLLLQHYISGAPVLDDQGRLVGILTKRDCLEVAFGASYHQEWAGPVSRYMSTNVETVDADADLVEVADLFRKRRFRRFPVMSGSRVVGIIARHDILRGLDELW
jgi:CBS domain-containing protein